ncbi:MAG: metallophosphoesterase [Ferruginibacter sp.]
MRRLLQYLFKKLITRIANKYAAAPDRKSVFKSLSKLYRLSEKENKTICVKEINGSAKFIIFSDQHKGNGDHADDFRASEINYINALKYYAANDFTFINLGDSEELWKYKPEQVIPKCTEAFKAEAAFQEKDRYIKTFGNHDLLWKNKMDVDIYLKNNFRLPLPVWEAVLLKVTLNEKLLSVLLTHGHQGDKMSDNNRFSTWMVAHLWTPFQRYLRINVNTPSNDDFLRNKHNRIMYEWSSRGQNLLLITGHTHQPVFASGRYSNHSSNDFSKADLQNVKPSYFNSGCCCFNDGDITGIEIADEFIRLIKWHQEGLTSNKKVLEEKALVELVKDLADNKELKIKN